MHHRQVFGLCVGDSLADLRLKVDSPDHVGLVIILPNTELYKFSREAVLHRRNLLLRLINRTVADVNNLGGGHWTDRSVDVGSFHHDCLPVFLFDLRIREFIQFRSVEPKCTFNPGVVSFDIFTVLFHLYAQVLVDFKVLRVKSRLDREACLARRLLVQDVA